MQVTSSQEFVTLKADKSTPKKEFKYFTAFTPALAQAIQQIKMSYDNIFVEVVKEIKLVRIVLTPLDDRNFECID